MSFKLFGAGLLPSMARPLFPSEKSMAPYDYYSDNLFTSLKKVSRDFYQHRVKTSERIFGIVLQVIGKEEPPVGHYLHTYYSKYSDTLPKLVQLRVRVPEIHVYFPIPENIGDSASDSDQSIIDMYPIFVAEDENAEIPEAGQLVAVQFLDKESFGSPIYLKPIESKMASKITNIIKSGTNKVSSMDAFLPYGVGGFGCISNELGIAYPMPDYAQLGEAPDIPGQIYKPLRDGYPLANAKDSENIKNCFYGQKRITDKVTGFVSHHKGLDLYPAPGTPVFAIRDGTARVSLDAKYWDSKGLLITTPGKVTRSKTFNVQYDTVITVPLNATEQIILYPFFKKHSDKRCGLLVKIDTPNWATHEYMHLSGIAVSNGQKVKKNQLIGFVGGTDVQDDPPHLHISIKVKNTPGWRYVTSPPLTKKITKKDGGKAAAVFIDPAPIIGLKTSSEAAMKIYKQFSIQFNVPLQEVINFSNAEIKRLINS